MIVDSSFFIGERNIPNTSYPDVQSLLYEIAKVRERELLVSVLGYELFSLIDSDNTDVRIETLRNGMNTGQHTFAGLTGENSPLVDYVYYHFLKATNTTTTGIGETKSAGENTTVASPARKMVSAWNDMVCKLRHLIWYINNNRTEYPEYTGNYFSNFFTRMNILSV